MNNAILFNFDVDKENKKIKVERSFDAPLDLVWSAWTEPELLDQWWAPKPWKAETKTMDFTEGGKWLYSMVGPEGERHWALFNYKSIVPRKSYSGRDAFCDENGKENTTLPGAFWKNEFSESAGTSSVNIEISFENLSDLEVLINMGFKEGFTMGLGNLEELLARIQKKTT